MNFKIFPVVGVLCIIFLLALTWYIWKMPASGQGSAEVVPNAGVGVTTPSGLGDKYASAIKAVQGSDARVEFETTNDLYRFVQKLSSPEESKNADSLWLIAKVVDYCYSYGISPAGFTSDTEVLLRSASKDAAVALKAARDRVASRCSGFAGNSDDKTFSSLASLANKVRAAKAGSLAAEASLIVLNSPLHTDPDYFSNLTQRITLSKDPDAYLAISDAVGVGAADRNPSTSEFGTEHATYAWQLAACRRGLNCSSSGNLMSMYCVNGGVCGTYSNFEDLLFNGLLPASERVRVNEMTNRILSQGELK